MSTLFLVEDNETTFSIKYFVLKLLLPFVLLTRRCRIANRAYFGDGKFRTGAIEDVLQLQKIIKNNARFEKHCEFFILKSTDLITRSFPAL